MSAFTNARAIRVAFLVEEAGRWPLVLDAIFADCYTRWGGRFNLVVPCSNGEVAPAYRKWLKAYDPDIIYSYVDLSAHYLSRLHEELCPSFLILHQRPGEPHEARTYAPELPVEPLGALSVILEQQVHPLFGNEQLGVVDVHWGSNSYFIEQSFGKLGRPPTLDVLEHVHTHTLVTQEVLDDKRRQNILGFKYTSPIELLRAAATERSAVGMAQLSAWACPRIELGQSRWGRSFSVVIGASFIDRITFWNGRSQYRTSTDRWLVTVNVTKEELEGDDFFSAFALFLRDRARVNDGGASQYFVTLRSASTDTAGLEDLRKKLNEAKVGLIIDASPVAGIGDCVPTEEALHRNDFRLHRGFFEGNYERDILNTDDSFRPPTVLPRHLREVVPIPGWARDGHWMQDLDVERTNNYSKYSNVCHRWRLPRRMPATDALVRPYHVGRGRPLYPRVNLTGTLSLFASLQAELPTIAQPTDATFFDQALCGAPQPWPFRREDHQPHKSLVFATRPSDKGRYLRALLNRARGLEEAFDIFLNSFWKGQFEKLGATPSSTEARTDVLVALLKKRFGNVVSLETNNQWERLARIVLQEGQASRRQGGHLRFDKLKEDFDAFRKQYWDGQQGNPHGVEWVADEIRSLPLSLQYLCQRQILHQGHEWRCRRCYNSNWVSVEALQRILECDVCGAKARAPVDQAWKFKLDNFVFDGLREHGMLGYIWCLSRLRERAGQSFFFSEPIELFYTSESADHGRADAEIDLLVVTDGVIRLCEVKSSRRGIDIYKLADVAVRLRPDIVTLAVMEPAANISHGLDRALNERLAGTGISGEVITLNKGDFEDDPTLPVSGWDEVEGE